MTVPTNRPIDSIVKSLGKLSARWLKKSFSYRKKAIERLERRSQFTRKQSEALLDALFSELTQKKLFGLLKTELQNPYVLDGFCRDVTTKKFHHAVGPKLITHIFSANVPNPAIVSFVLGMLVKSTNVGKVSSRDPGILDIYLASLRQHDSKLAKTNFLLAANDKKGLDRWIQKSDLVVAYGNDETLSDIRKKIPDGVVFYGYGHRVSFSLYTQEALNSRDVRSLARKTAKDIWMMDQRGCLSPTIVYVEHGGEILPFSFAEHVRNHLEKDRWTVLYDGKPGQFPLSGGGKIIFIRAFEKVQQVYSQLAPIRRYLQAVALETSVKKRSSIAKHLADLGVNRICSAGRLQFPPLTWHHDGRPSLASWLTWTDLEV